MLRMSVESDAALHVRIVLSSTLETLDPKP